MAARSLRKAAARAGRPVLLKRGFGATIDEWLAAAEYLLDGGAPGVILCERGIRSFEPGTRATLDVGGLALAKLRTGLPVIADPSHAAGTRALVRPLARASLAAGADGLIVECHAEPGRARSDGPQALTPADVAELARAVASLAPALGRRAPSRYHARAHANQSASGASAISAALFGGPSGRQRSEAEPMNDDIRAAELRVAEVIGGLMEFWGFKAVMGRLWTFLYLAPEPLSAAELGERLQASTGAVSMALADLQQWGVVEKGVAPGRAARLLRARDQHLEDGDARVPRARAGVRTRGRRGVRGGRASCSPSCAPRPTARARSAIKFIDGRLSSLLTLSRIGEGLLLMLSTGQPVDPQPIKTLFHPEDES